MRDREPREPTTVLDHLRPTVVRRRVVVDVATLNQPKLEKPSTPESEPATEPSATRASGCYPRASVAYDDEAAPPSSVIAPEGYDLGADADQEEGYEEEEEVEGLEEVGQQARSESVVDPRPAIELGPTIAVGTIAKRLGLTSAQVAAELVSRGFFEVTPATVLTRDTARVVADAFGRAVIEVAEPEPVKAKAKTKVKVKAPPKRTARRAAPTKRTAKASTKPKKRTKSSTRRAA